MTMKSEEILALDIGGKRIGVARANTIARIPEALETILVDGNEVERIKDIATELGATKLVIGLPRNQSGDETSQSAHVREFAKKLDGFEIVWQDESLTSVIGEEFLRQNRKTYTKADIDSMAAFQILKDYLDE